MGGTGSNDNDQFVIVDGNLNTNLPETMKPQTPNTFVSCATDAGGAYFEKQFTISIENVNETPTDVYLSNNTVPENQPAGTVVGDLFTIDPDSGDTFTYVLVAGAGSGGNSNFVIDGNTLKTTASFDFETTPSDSIRVRSTDAGGLETEKILTISVGDVGEGSTEIELSQQHSRRKQLQRPRHWRLSRLSILRHHRRVHTPTRGLIAGVGDADNGAFEISGANLEAGSSFDDETKNTYSIRVRVTDEDGDVREGICYFGDQCQRIAN